MRIGLNRLPDKLEFDALAVRLPLPMGEVPPKGAERALSVTAKAVPAPPEGEPSLAALSKVVSSVWG